MSDPVIIMRRSDLEQVIENATTRALRRYVRSQKSYDEWITKKEVMEILEYKSPVSVDNLVKAGKIERRYKNNRPYFKFSDVLKIQKNKI